MISGFAKMFGGQIWNLGHGSSKSLIAVVGGGPFPVLSTRA